MPFVGVSPLICSDIKASGDPAMRQRLMDDPASNVRAGEDMRRIVFILAAVITELTIVSFGL